MQLYGHVANQKLQGLPHASAAPDAQDQLDRSVSRDRKRRVQSST